jgi:NRPS condensation-like uncharacterized protein
MYLCQQYPIAWGENVGIDFKKLTLFSHVPYAKHSPLSCSFSLVISKPYWQKILYQNFEDGIK